MGGKESKHLPSSKAVTLKKHMRLNLTFSNGSTCLTGLCISSYTENSEFVTTNLLTCCELLWDSGALSRPTSDGSEVHTVLWKLQVLASTKLGRLVLMGGFWCLRVCTSTQRAPLSIKSDYDWLQISDSTMELDEYWSKCLFADRDQMGKKKKKEYNFFTWIFTKQITSTLRKLWCMIDWHSHLNFLVSQIISVEIMEMCLCS